MINIEISSARTVITDRPTCWNFRLNTLLIIATVFCQQDVYAGSLSQVQHHAVSSLVARDWSAFRKISAPRLLLQRIQIVHAGSLTDSTTKLFPDFNPLSNGQTEDLNLGYLTVTEVTVDTRARFTKLAWAYLSAFSAQVKSTVYSIPNGIVCGPDVPGSTVETSDFYGPAVEGIENADTSWRIGFEYIHGKWLVRSLVEAHA